MKLLLDYFFPITAISPTPQASTAFLKQLCLVVKPKGGVSSGLVTQCSTMAQVLALTDNTEAQQAFAAGLSKVYILTSDSLDLTDALNAYSSDFYTLAISSDFSESDVTLATSSGIITISDYADLVSAADDVLEIGGVSFVAQEAEPILGEATFKASVSNAATAGSLAAQINAHPIAKKKVFATVAGAIVTVTAFEPGFTGNDVTMTYTDNDSNIGLTLAGLSAGKLSGGAGLSAGGFTGVIGVSSDDTTFLKAQAAIENRVAFYAKVGTNAKNLVYAFGKILSNALTWSNQQYISMPFTDDAATLGEANSMFDDKISFVLSDDEYGNRLGLFAAGGKAIAAPYIVKNLQIDLQSGALSYISGNQPTYSIIQAALLEDELQKIIDNKYVARQLIDAGEVEVALEQQNFVASGYINIAEPTALWRIFGQIKQTL